METLLTPTEAARYLGIPRKTLLSEMPGGYRHGKHVYYVPWELEQLAQNWCEGTQDPPKEWVNKRR